jgi:hypothetical protein
VLSLGDARCQAGRPSTAVIGNLRLGGDPAGPRFVLSSCRPRTGASASARRRHLDFREETPVSSSAVAFDLVRRESVWQRAGPSEGASSRTSPRRIPGLPGAGRTQDHQGDPRPGSASDDVEGRTTGATFGPHRTRTPRWVIPPDPKPHERDRMKHAGWPRRGATRPGREKRRRRNEASVEARDEEPGPIGTCTPTILLGGAPGAVFRPPPSITASFGSPGSSRESAVVRWRVPTVRSGPGLDGVPAQLPPSGSSRNGTSDGSEPDRARWDAVGHQGAARKSISGWTDERFAPATGTGSRSRPQGRHPVHRRRSVLRVSSAGRLSSRRTPAVPAWKGTPGSPNRLLRQPTRRWSGRDGDANHGDASTQRSRPRATGRNTAARRPHGRTRDLAPGSELSRVGALEGRRTSWEGAWERPVGVDRTASRPTS